MGKWGWMLISIGCIVMMYSQTYEEFNTSMMVLVSGLAIIVIGGIMCYSDYHKKNRKK